MVTDSLRAQGDTWNFFSIVYICDVFEWNWNELNETKAAIQAVAQY